MPRHADPTAERRHPGRPSTTGPAGAERRSDGPGRIGGGPGDARVRP